MTFPPHRVTGPVAVASDVPERLHEMVGEADGPALSEWMLRHGSLEQLLEFHIHRSAWQLEEADAHSWALPRLSGAAKAALAEIQADEYGGSVEKGIHAELYTWTMCELGLDDTYGAYLDVIPGVTLATVNLASYFDCTAGSVARSWDTSPCSR